MQPITDAQFVAMPGLEEWRVLRHAAEATFVAPTFTDAVRFVNSVIDAWAASGYAGDVDLRPDGSVRILLASAHRFSISDTDAVAAREISRIAGSHGLSSCQATLTRVEIAIDAMDIGAVMPFWRAILGYINEPSGNSTESVAALIDPAGIGPSVWFQQMDRPRPQRNRVHVDVTVAHDEAQARMDAALAAGGMLLNDAEAKAFWVLSDPEGNEACICTWQDRD